MVQHYMYECLMSLKILLKTGWTIGKVILHMGNISLSCVTLFSWWMFMRTGSEHWSHRLNTLDIERSIMSGHVSAYDMPGLYVCIKTSLSCGLGYLDHGKTFRPWAVGVWIMVLPTMGCGCLEIMVIPTMGCGRLDHGCPYHGLWVSGSWSSLPWAVGVWIMVVPTMGCGCLDHGRPYHGLWTSGSWSSLPWAVGVWIMVVPTMGCGRLDHGRPYHGLWVSGSWSSLPWAVDVWIMVVPTMGRGCLDHGHPYHGLWTFCASWSTWNPPTSVMRTVHGLLKYRIQCIIPITNVIICIQ